MVTEHEVNEKAILAMSLRRRNRTISQIALYLDCKKRYVYTLLSRAENLWSLLVDANDFKTDDIVKSSFCVTIYINLRLWHFILAPCWFLWHIIIKN